MTDEELVKALRDFADDGYADLSIAAADRIEALTEQLKAARADAKEAEVVEIDLRHVMMDEIEKAVAESPWIPAEYYMNEVVSDICDFLRSPRNTEAKLAKAVEGLREIAGECGCSTARAIIAEIEGSDAP
jgi:hypothetical protein